MAPRVGPLMKLMKLIDESLQPGVVAVNAQAPHRVMGRMLSVERAWAR